MSVCVGEKAYKLEEFLPIYENISKEKDTGTFADFNEAFKTFDREGQGYMSAAELRHVLTGLGKISTTCLLLSDWLGAVLRFLRLARFKMCLGMSFMRSDLLETALDWLGAVLRFLRLARFKMCLGRSFMRSDLLETVLDWLGAVLRFLRLAETDDRDLKCASVGLSFDRIGWERCYASFDWLRRMTET